jgi:hypothetical protein
MTPEKPYKRTEPESKGADAPGSGLQEAYNAGRDSAIHGANTTNCHFRHFATREKTMMWERGRASIS